MKWNVHRFVVCRAISATLFALVLSLAAQPALADHTHVVVYGDTLSHIAANYGMTVDELVWLNGMDDPDLIFPGEVIALEAEGSSGDTGSDSELAGAEASTSWSDGAAPPQGGGALFPPYVEPWDVRWLLENAAERYGWDPNLIMAQAWQESGWRQDQVSWVGAVGVMQVMPSTADQLDNWYFGRDIDIWWSVTDNIEAGVAYLSVLYEITGSVELSLASYFQGWASVQRDGLFPETEEYLARIFAFQERFANGELP